MLGDKFIQLGTGSSSETFAVSLATLFMTCSGNIVLEHDIVILPSDLVARVILADSGEYSCNNTRGSVAPLESMIHSVSFITSQNFVEAKNEVNRAPSCSSRSTPL